MLKSLKEKLVINKPLILIILTYFFLRLINLITPPLFNDEAIYLDWGYREIHREGFLFYSLYDGKQPFLMWTFGIMETFFSPVFSGRIIAVFTGFLTIIGLYKTSELLFNKSIGYLSSIFYTVIPIFSFYDRQALMESSVAAVGVWALYYLLKFTTSKRYLDAVLLGFILGIGYFIKTTAFIFFICSFLIIIFLFITRKEKWKIVQKSLVSFFVFFLSIFLLIINPQFWSTLGGNSRYVFSISDLLTLPVNSWFSTLFANIEILFIYLTPLVFVSSTLGVALLIKNKELEKRIFIFYFLFVLLLETLSVKIPSERYIVSYLPFAVITASLFFYEVFKKNALGAKALFLISALIPLSLTILQVLNQPQYILFTGKFTRFNHPDYLESYSSGYGVNETIEYLKKLSNGKKIMVGVAENTGNPESAMLVYFAKDKLIQVAYLDSRIIQADLSPYDCLKTPLPTYFVSRDDQQGGLEKFFEKMEIIENPYGKNTIGIYKLKTDCKGKVLEIYPKYNPV